MAQTNGCRCRWLSDAPTAPIYAHVEVRGDVPLRLLVPAECRPSVLHADAGQAGGEGENGQSAVFAAVGCDEKSAVVQQ